MKILFIGYYREPTIWGKKSEMFIRQLAAIEEVEVVCRAIDLRPNGTTPSSIAQYEYNSLDKIDLCFQHVLPEHFVGTNLFQCVPLFDKTPESWNFFNFDGGYGWRIPETFSNDKNFGCWASPSCMDMSGSEWGVDPDLATKKYDPISITNTEGTFKVYTLCGGQKELRALEGALKRFNEEFAPYQKISYTIFTTMPEEVKSEVDRCNSSIRINIVPIENLDVPLPHIHNWGDYFDPITVGSSYTTGEAKALGTPATFGKEDFEKWEENPVSWEMDHRKEAIKRAKNNFNYEVKKIRELLGLNEENNIA